MHGPVLEGLNAELIVALENTTLETQSGSRSAGTVHVVGTSELVLSCKCIALLFHLPEDPGNQRRLLELIYLPGSDRFDGIVGCLP